MKSFTTLLSLAALQSFVVGSPVANRDSLSVYRFKLSSTTDALNGKYLSINNSTVGVYDRDPVEVYTTAVQHHSEKTRLELHTYPIGIIDHVLSITGSGGLFELKDLVTPATVPDADWTNFSLTKPEGPDTSNASALTYNGASGKWIVFPLASGLWRLNFYTGEAVVTLNYIPVEIILEKVGQDDEN